MPHSPRSTGLPIFASWRRFSNSVGAQRVAERVAARDGQAWCSRASGRDSRSCPRPRAASPGRAPWSSALIQSSVSMSASIAASMSCTICSVACLLAGGNCLRDVDLAERLAERAVGRRDAALPARSLLAAARAACGRRSELLGVERGGQRVARSRATSCQRRYVLMVSSSVDSRRASRPRKNSGLATLSSVTGGAPEAARGTASSDS